MGKRHQLGIDRVPHLRDFVLRRRSVRMSGAVTQVWDTGGTVFNTTSRLKSLIEAVTVENVQPQAIFAAEALGFGIHVRDELLVKAVDALSGNENVRWENLKLLIGICSGELHKTIRTSRSLSSFFLFVCACKVCFTDAEIGDLALQMILASGVIKRYPIASYQLGDLIKSFSGHAESLAPADLMHALAVEMDQHTPRGIQLYQRFNAKELATLLVRCFELLSDDSIDGITLLGGTDGLLLATIFSWLIPGRVCISINGKILSNKSIDGQMSTYETENSKLSLQLETSSDPGTYTDNWIIKEWRKGQPTEFVVETRETFETSVCQYIPLSMTKSLFTRIYCPQHLEDQIAGSVIGALASALIVLLSRCGSLHEPLNWYGSPEEVHATSQLWDVFPERWLEVYDSAITQYGWSVSGTVVGQKKALSLLEPAFQEQADRLADHGKVWRKVEAIASDFIVSELGEDLSEDDMEREIEISEIFDPAAHIATNAVATATCDFRSGLQRIAPLSQVSWGSAKEFFASLLSLRGMAIGKFRQYCFVKALPGNISFDVKDVVICSNGYTAGIYPLWNLYSTRKRNALAVRVCKGGIQRDKFRYDSIREAGLKFACCPSEGDLKQIRLFDGTDYSNLYPESDQDHLRVEHLIGEIGGRLELMSYLTASESYIKPVSWTRSIHASAIAVHHEQETGYTERQEMELAQRHAATLSQISWQSVHKWGCADIDAKTILKTSGNEQLRFFSCSVVYSELHAHYHSGYFQIVVRHSASLMSSVLAAENIADSWVIIC